MILTEEGMKESDNEPIVDIDEENELTRRNQERREEKTTTQVPENNQEKHKSNQENTNFLVLAGVVSYAN